MILDRELRARGGGREKHATRDDSKQRAVDPVTPEFHVSPVHEELPFGRANVQQRARPPPR